MPRQALRAAPNALSQFGLRFSFTFVLVFPVYRISAKGARAENPHGIKVVATGGLSRVIVPECRHDIIVDHALLLKGLKIIYDKNVE